MDKTNLVSCDLLGTSHGGAVAMMAAALAPDRFRRLILVDPVNPWSEHGKRLTAFFSATLLSRRLFLNSCPVCDSCTSTITVACSATCDAFRPDSLEGYRKPLRIPGSYEYALDIAAVVEPRS